VVSGGAEGASGGPQGWRLAGAGGSKAKRRALCDLGGSARADPGGGRRAAVLVGGDGGDLRAGRAGRGVARWTAAAARSRSGRSSAAGAVRFAGVGGGRSSGRGLQGGAAASISVLF